MNTKETTNDDLAQAITELSAAVAKGFERVEGQLKLLDDRVGVLEAEHKEVVTRIAQVPEAVDATYGRMLNDHRDRLHALEAA